MFNYAYQTSMPRCTCSIIFSYVVEHALCHLRSSILTDSSGQFLHLVSLEKERDTRDTNRAHNAYFFYDIF